MPRTAPHFDPIGKPPAQDAGELGPCPFTPDNCVEAAAWRRFVEEIPWLSKRDRCLLELACILRAKIAEGGDDATPINIMRLAGLVSKLGATPTDQSKVTTKETIPDDPADAFFG